MQPSSGVCQAATGGQSAPAVLDLSPIAAACSALLAALQAVQNQHSHFSPPAAGLQLVDLANQFLESKFNADRSPNYLRVTINQLRAFVTGRESRPVNSITAAELERWAHSKAWAPRTKRGHLMTLRTVFQWGVDRALLVANPAKGVDIPAHVERPPIVHRPDQAARILAAALKLDPSACRCLAVRYFAGLRTSEAVALSESEILPGHIEVTAAKSKTRRRRLVPILPNLAAWLAVTKAAGGALPLPQFNNRLRWATAAGGEPFPPGVCRHSFATYHLAKFKSASATALECGHTESVLFRHYRELATESAGVEFFNIFPPGWVFPAVKVAVRKSKKGVVITLAAGQSSPISQPGASAKSKNAGNLRFSRLSPGRGRRS